MTPDEYRAWQKDPNLPDGICERKVVEISNSLAAFYTFLAGYAWFDSLTWLVENNFDIGFTAASKDQTKAL